MNLKKKREKTQINNNRNERVEIIIDTTEIQKIVRECYEQVCAKKLEKLNKWINF